MNKSAKSKDGMKVARGQLWLHLSGMVREALYDTVIGAGLACVEEVMERERVALCGVELTRFRGQWRSGESEGEPRCPRAMHGMRRSTGGE